MITDSHLTEHCPERAVFRFLLEKISCSDYDVLFMGDIFDVWIGTPGYETSVHHEFMTWCCREKEKRNIWYLEGNHEFFISRNRSQYFTEVFSEGVFLDDGAFYAAHGDMVNEQDKSYAFLRGFLRNPISYLVMKLFGYTGFGTSFSGEIRKDLKGINQKQKHYFPESELRRLDQKLRSFGVKYAAVGHFHRSEQVGSVTVLENFTDNQYMTGVYHPGKGIEQLPLRELFGEWK